MVAFGHGRDAEAAHLSGRLPASLAVDGTSPARIGSAPAAASTRRLLPAPLAPSSA